jgi:hypothetical protein
MLKNEWKANGSFVCTVNCILAVTVRTTRFNIQKFYMVLTLRLCVLYGSENKQRLLPYTTLTN